MSKANKTRGWTSIEDEALVNAVKLHGAKNWKKISTCVKGRSEVQCQHRWQKVLNPELVKGPWTEAEDDKMRELVNIYGPKRWSFIASHLPGRIGKQCRERWTNHLDPSIKKGAWETWEDELIVKLQSEIGNKWAKIAQYLPGRTDNSIKNRFNSTISRKTKVVPDENSIENEIDKSQTANYHLKPQHTYLGTQSEYSSNWGNLTSTNSSQSIEHHEILFETRLNPYIRKNPPSILKRKYSTSSLQPDKRLKICSSTNSMEPPPSKSLHPQLSLPLINQPNLLNENPNHSFERHPFVDKSLVTLELIQKNKNKIFSMLVRLSEADTKTTCNIKK